MELYITKKMAVDDEFVLPSVNTLPYLHVITPLVEVKNDTNGNLYISSSEDPNAIANLVKLKRILLKQEFGKKEGDKVKLTDEVLWLRTSPVMQYKNSTSRVFFNKMITGMPIKLQLSCKQVNMHTYDKPYSSVNLFWTVDTVIVDDAFDFNLLSP